MLTIKSVQCKGYGGPENWFWNDAEIPIVKKGCVLVQVKASSINPIDWKLRQGMLKVMTGLHPPKFPGSDFSGIVLSRCPSVSRFDVNDRVFGMVSALKGGAWADKLWVCEKQLEIIPENVSFEDAAVSPLACMTALQGLVSIAKIKRGMQVFVRGCTGGVGQYAVQVAKAEGAVVLGSCRGSNVEFATHLGVDDVVNYEEDQSAQALPSCDIFFDVCGGAPDVLIQQYLKPSGVYLTTQPYPREYWLSLRSMLSKKFLRRVIVLKQCQSDLKVISNMLAAGHIKSYISQRFSLSEIVKASSVFQAGGLQGKVALLSDD